MDSNDAEIIELFLEESRENLDQFDRDLVALEAAPADTELLARVFRTVHTVKGTCGFLGFTKLEALSHAGEDLLGALRAGDVALDAGITSSLLTLGDRIRTVLDVVESTGTEADDDHAALIAELEGHLGPQHASAADAYPVPAPSAPAAGGQPPTRASENTVRVDVGVLDTLMDLVGELVLARNQIAEIAAVDDDGPLTLPYRQLRLATSELQEGVRQARLQPIGTVTSRFRRIVRDLAVGVGKQVRVEIEGEEVGVDKAINEALGDPLLHLVRNAVDHGIEAPADRVAAGKPAEGTVRISAMHSGGRVEIQVSDDGRGVDPARLVDRAVASGVLAPEAATALSERDALELMFHPGLSTKEEVTNLSGRGVGMDVVRSSLDQVGGSVEVTSEPGRGTLFRISVPLTLTIMPAVVIWCGGQRYAIPQIEVEEVVSLDAAQAAASVDDVAGARIYRLRGQLLPLVDLATQLGAPPPEGDGLTIAVVESASKRYGLIVDRVGDMTEMVVKPLTKATRGIPVFAGVTILGDGVPSLVLDGAGLATRAGITTPTAEPTGTVAAAGVENDPGLLVLSTPDGGRVAVELGRVQRLEHVPVASVERVGRREVLQYGDTILPLLRVEQVLSNGLEPAPDEAGAALPTVVCQSSAGLVGLVVGHVEDIVPTVATPIRGGGRRGVAGSVVVDDRVTELLDVEALIADLALDAGS
ncbi:MAG: chemotaxis protein CheA [Acidimicrobiia bacterium]|nr:chemotaxis protein CheA [Acidimicrobiia bacterium]